jgi:two-component system LytT family sensor kinase
MTIWVLAYHLYHYHRYRLETIEQNAALELIAKQAQLDNLSTQLNPHFLFNSLNSIKSLIIENPAVARRAVDLLSDILRTSLYQKIAAFISVKEELSLVEDYVALEKIRFEERLNMTVLMDEGVGQYQILPKPLLQSPLRSCSGNVQRIQILLHNRKEFPQDRYKYQIRCKQNPNLLFW